MPVHLTSKLMLFGGAGPLYSQPRTTYEYVDLGGDFDYAAWVSVPYYNVLSGGVLGAQNAVTAEVMGQVTSNGVATDFDPIAYGAKLGPLGAYTNLRPMAWNSTDPRTGLGPARYIAFRLQVWGTALEVAAQGHVLYPI
jgi:hypothetical protein